MTTIYEQIERFENLLETNNKTKFNFDDYLFEFEDILKYDDLEKILKYLCKNSEGQTLPLTPFLYNYLSSIEDDSDSLESENYHTLNELATKFNKIPRKTEDKNGIDYIIK
jgi:hypothetical protein